MNKAALISGVILILMGVFRVLTYDADSGKALLGILLVLTGGIILIIAKVKGD